MLKLIKGKKIIPLEHIIVKNNMKMACVTKVCV